MYIRYVRQKELLYWSCSLHPLNEQWCVYRSDNGRGRERERDEKRQTKKKGRKEGKERELRESGIKKCMV